MSQPIVAVTGTERGGTTAQLRLARAILFAWSPTVLIHGGCIGVDDELDQLACELSIRREVFPAQVDYKKRVPEHLLLGRKHSSVVIHPVQPPLVRNRIMVRRASRALALPGEAREVVRSGTWATVRFARTLLPREYVVVIAPDGSRIQ